jgi:CRP-like cAMP-binding protein
MVYPNQHIELCLENPSSVFKGLNQKDKELIVQHHSISRIKKGGYLYREGDRSKGLICLSAGKAKIYRIGVGGREHIIKMIGAGDLTGYQAVFSESVWPAFSIAIEDSAICTIEKNCLLKVLRNNADISMKFNKILAEELSHSYDKMVSLTQKHVRGRLAESLLMLAEIYGFESDGMTINAAVSRNDMAHLSNMTTSNAIRTLSNFASEGVLRVKGRKVTILNPEELEKISEQA